MLSLANKFHDSSNHQNPVQVSCSSGPLQKCVLQFYFCQCFSIHCRKIKQQQWNKTKQNLVASLMDRKYSVTFGMLPYWFIFCLLFQISVSSTKISHVWGWGLSKKQMKLTLRSKSKKKGGGGITSEREYEKKTSRLEKSSERHDWLSEIIYTMWASKAQSFLLLHHIWEKHIFVSFANCS